MEVQYLAAKFELRLWKFLVSAFPVIPQIMRGTCLPLDQRSISPK